MHIGVLGFLVANIFGAASGLLAGLRRGKLADQIITPLAYIGICILFSAGYLLMYVFGLKLTGCLSATTRARSMTLVEYPQLVMPVICDPSPAGFSFAPEAFRVLEVVHRTISVRPGPRDCGNGTSS
jgi:hypothetical protein